MENYDVKSPPPDIIRVDFERLATVPGLFTNEAERVAAALSAIDTHTPLVRAGWEGPAADTFFAAMDSDIRPALARTVSALRLTADVTALMIRILDQAEQDAARIDWSGGGVIAVAPANDGAAVTPAREEGRRGGGGNGKFIGDAQSTFDRRAALESSGLAAAPPSSGAAASQVSLQSSLDGQTQPPIVEDGPNSAAGRSHRYRQWSAILDAMAPPARDIRFFDAAAHVTMLLGMADSGIAGTALRMFENILNGDGWLGWGAQIDFSAASPVLDGIGRVLYELTSNIFTRLLPGDMINSEGMLISPLAGEPNYSEDLVVESGIHFDTHMVLLEQMTVTELLNDALDGGALSAEQVVVINFLLNAEEYAEEYAWAASLLNGDTRFVD